MDESLFKDCLNSWQKSDGYTKFWPQLAEKWGWDNSEKLRDTFKKERKRRGIIKEELKKTPFNSKLSMPRVAIMDIETLPAETLNFNLFDQNIGIEQVVSDICLLSWSAKFLNESEIYSDILTPEEAPIKNDRRIAQSAWDFISKCDFIIGHNWNGFDGKILNVAFLQYDIPPLKYSTIDTYLVAKQSFKFSSSSLKFINKKLGIRNKIDNDGFPLWRSCLRGDKNSLDTMLEYNIGDILATEQLFYRLQPYVKNLNVALFNEINKYQCPVCGSENLKEEGFYYTSGGKWESVRCSDCGCVSRKKNNLLDKEKKKSLLVNS